MTNTRKAVRILKDSPSDAGNKTPLPKAFSFPSAGQLVNHAAAQDGFQLLNRTHSAANTNQHHDSSINVIYYVLKGESS
jgi:hypothetical protein